MRTGLGHPVCEPCRRGDHEDCIEGLPVTDGMISNLVCGCEDEWHYEEDEVEKGGET